MRVRIMLVVAIATAVTAAHAVPPTMRTQVVAATTMSIRPDIAVALKEEGLIGATWATLDSDGSIASGAAGLKDAQNGSLLDPDDKIHVGSVAKSLLATGILRLVSEGRLGLDTPVAQVLPDVRFD